MFGLLTRFGNCYYRPETIRNSKKNEFYPKNIFLLTLKKQTVHFLLRLLLLELFSLSPCLELIECVSLAPAFKLFLVLSLLADLFTLVLLWLTVLFCFCLNSLSFFLIAWILKFWILSPSLLGQNDSPKSGLISTSSASTRIHFLFGWEIGFSIISKQL